MKLAGHDIVPPHARGERDAIGGCRGSDLFVAWIHKKGMDKIPIRPIGDPLKYWTGPLDIHLIPSHVGNFQSMILRKGSNPPRKNIQSLMPTEFFTFRKQQLKPEANSQKRLSRLDRRPDRINQLILFEVHHAIAKRPNAR